MEWLDDQSKLRKIWKQVKKTFCKILCFSMVRLDNEHLHKLIIS